MKFNDPLEASNKKMKLISLASLKFFFVYKNGGGVAKEAEN